MHFSKALAVLSTLAVFVEAGYGTWDAQGRPQGGAAAGRLVRLKRGGFGTVSLDSGVQRLSKWLLILPSRTATSSATPSAEVRAQVAVVVSPSRFHRAKSKVSDFACHQVDLAVAPLAEATLVLVPAPTRAKVTLGPLAVVPTAVSKLAGLHND